MYEHDQVTLTRHVDTNVHREKIHQECTPGHVYVVFVSIIQQASKTPSADATLIVNHTHENKKRKGSAHYLQGTSMVQPTRQPCGNPWSEEIYGGLGEKVTSLPIRND
ncbi:hypothetical protein Taro_032915 [Colocasia esculenta]|uniref:Uncharacterized protein n=1 Tax=Colocasia esculenta TaxID=4460 RepID=A0A843VWA3_COLES|nr:hypothetical protein [Colocasia esculenta]